MTAFDVVTAKRASCARGGRLCAAADVTAGRTRHLSLAIFGIALQVATTCGRAARAAIVIERPAPDRGEGKPGRAPWAGYAPGLPDQWHWNRRA